jgi:hypothetical protein
MPIEGRVAAYPPPRYDMCARYIVHVSRKYVVYIEGIYILAHIPPRGSHLFRSHIFPGGDIAEITGGRGAYPRSMRLAVSAPRRACHIRDGYMQA